MSPSAYKACHDIRVVGVDDGSFGPANSRRDQQVLLVAAFLRGFRLETIELTLIERDGLDVTQKLWPLLKNKKVDAILLSGVTFAGFNVLDVVMLARLTRRPVIVVAGRRPNNASMLFALRKHFPDWPERWRRIRQLGRPRKVVTSTEEPPLYFEAFGIAPKRSAALLRSLSITSRLPEPLRMAGLIARGLTKVNLGG